MRPTLGYVDAADVLHRSSITRDLCTILLPVSAFFLQVWIFCYQFWYFFTSVSFFLPAWEYCYQRGNFITKMWSFCYQCRHFVTSVDILLPVCVFSYQCVGNFFLPAWEFCYQRHFVAIMGILLPVRAFLPVWKILLPVWVFCYHCGYLETKCDVGQNCHGQNCGINRPNFLSKRASVSWLYSFSTISGNT